jgi:hypothetical protein
MEETRRLLPEAAQGERGKVIEYDKVTGKYVKSQDAM